MRDAPRLPSLDPEYAVEELIGEGDTDTVYRAVDRQGQTVAIKLYDHRMERDTVFVANFRREARRACDLHHPNVLRTLSYGYEDGQYYLVTEYVDGESLGRFLDLTPGPMNPAAIRAFLDACAGLDYLHARGIVHLSVKPSNILIRSSGEALVADLGPVHQPGTSGLTSTLEMATSVTYMSPEQLLNLQLTPASDVYSLGVILYQLCTGRLPFDAPSPIATAVQKLEEEPVPLESAIPAGLARVVLRCLERDPRQRYRAAGALAADLREAALAAARNTASMGLFQQTEQAGEALPRRRGTWGRAMEAVRRLTARRPWSPSPRRTAVPARTEHHS